MPTVQDPAPIGKFAAITAHLPELAALTSARIDDVHPDDILTTTDGDGDTLRVGYFVRDECDGSPISAGFHLHTPPGGVLISLDVAEHLAEWLVMFIDQAKEAELQ